MNVKTGTLVTDYAGKRWSLLRLGFKTSALTVLSLGFYRFWMKTRLRRFYWSAIRPGGLPLEYTGTGVEKLMGFLIAVVFLAFYIGVFNLILMFISYSLLNNGFAAYVMSFVGLIPIFFFARYRARRYILARTRWRGIRFGVDKAAWAYSWRAMAHWALTILTVGILLPRQTFWLEKFRTDRTWYGNARFRQDGNWRMLRPAMHHVYLGVALAVFAGLLLWLNPGFLGVAFAIGSILWIFFGFIYYNVEAFRILTNNKLLDDEIAFLAAPKPARIFRFYVLGNFLVYLILASLGFACLAVFGVFAEAYNLSLDPTVPMMDLSPGLQWLSLVGGALLYFVFFILWGVLRQVLVSLPVLQHYSETTAILNARHLSTITQRARDETTGAEGFAEALDVGAAI